MKRLFIAILLTIALVGFQFSRNTTEAIAPDKNIKITFDNSQNDLVYHDLGTAIKLSNNSKLIINNLDLHLNDESAIIYIINLENNESFKLCDYYKPQHDISYISKLDGIYKIIAKISNGNIFDLSPKAIIENSITEDDNNGIITLQNK